MTDEARLRAYFEREWTLSLQGCGGDANEARHYILTDAAVDLSIDDDDLLASTFDKWRRGDL